MTRPVPEPRRPKPAATEATLYKALSLSWITPEIRENSTTIERAEAGLPSLSHPRGYTGRPPHALDVERRCPQLWTGWRRPRWPGVIDTLPSRTTRPRPGSPAVWTALRSGHSRPEIARVQEDLSDIRILRGCEVDILPDGSLDIEDEFLAELDLVLVSVHSSFDMPEARMTDRIIRALENPLVHVLCHPTGRKLGRRLRYPVDLDEGAACGGRAQRRGRDQRESPAPRPRLPGTSAVRRTGGQGRCRFRCAFSG